MDDTSISTHSPGGPRPSRTQLKWTNDMEVAFIATMKTMQSPPTKNVPSGFTKDAYKRVADIIKHKSSQPDLCDDVRMKNKLGALRNDWRTYVNLLNMQWPRLPNGLPTNTDDVLETYYKDQDPNARKFRAAPLKHFAELNALFDPEGEQPPASPSTSRPVPVSRISLPHSPYETVDYQAPPSTQVHDLQDTLTNGTNNNISTPHSGPVSHLSAKRPAETSISTQAKRILMANSPPTQPRAQDTLRAYYGNTSQISPVAAATALFTSTFSSLPIRHRVLAVKHFQDTNMAEIFLHADAELREGLINEWIKDAES
ncbi:hypothetical protein E4T48_07554 [Aureobasidium sp. EXF-10727]|nr:hypothetical protein E4T48_07554 [Aureobasidium sp. EXF-10727]